MENWTLHAAKTYVISELEAAEQSELQALRHLRNAGEEWIKNQGGTWRPRAEHRRLVQGAHAGKLSVARPSRGAGQRLAEILEREKMG